MARKIINTRISTTVEINLTRTLSSKKAKLTVRTKMRVLDPEEYSKNTYKSKVENNEVGGPYPNKY
jgi:hypothetical protein